MSPAQVLAWQAWHLAFHTVTNQPSQHAYLSQPDEHTVMNTAMIADAGGSQPHDNIQPYLTVNFCIALVGIYPSRS